MFLFYSKSADRPPCYGIHEKGNIKDYEQLSKISNWRKKLSNFHIAPIKIDGLTYASVEHYFHAQKFARDHPNFAFTFSMESASQWSKEPQFAKAVGGKTGKFKNRQYRPKHINMRDDFYSQIENELPFYKKVMLTGLYNKFAQHPKLRTLLLATGDAELWHLPGRNKQIVRVYELEKVRDCFRKIKTENYPELNFDYLFGKN